MSEVDANSEAIPELNASNKCPTNVSTDCPELATVLHEKCPTAKGNDLNTDNNEKEATTLGSPASTSSHLADPEREQQSEGTEEQKVLVDDLNLTATPCNNDNIINEKVFEEEETKCEYKNIQKVVDDTKLKQSFSDDEISLDDSLESGSENALNDDSSSSSESESESESELDDDIAQSNGDMEEEDGEVQTGPILSKNEATEETAPTLPDDYCVPENAPLEYVGDITALVERNAIIKANVSGEFRILKENSVLCFEDRQVLGLLFETFGRLQAPNYRVKFNSEDDFEKVKNKKGAKVFYVVPESQFVYTDALKKLKGTDASNCHDEELPEEEQEFSDDEREMAAKQEKKRKKKQRKSDGNGLDLPSKKRQQGGTEQSFLSYGFAKGSHIPQSDSQPHINSRPPPGDNIAQTYNNIYNHAYPHGQQYYSGQGQQSQIYQHPGSFQTAYQQNFGPPQNNLGTYGSPYNQVPSWSFGSQQPGSLQQPYQNWQPDTTLQQTWNNQLPTPQLWNAQGAHTEQQSQPQQMNSGGQIPIAVLQHLQQLIAAQACSQEKKNPNSDYPDRQ